jgi:nitroreductase
MDVIEAIRQRRSIRKYRPDAVEEEKLKSILEAGRLAPSAGNRQEWRYIIVKDPKKRALLSEAALGQTFVKQAPVVIVACAQTDYHKMTCGQLSYLIDVAISLDHMTLKAQEEGLGTCWVGAFEADKVKKILEIPEEVPVVELLTLGYPDETPPPRPRLPLEKITMYEKWEGEK